MIAATDTFTLTAGVLAVAAVVGFIASRARQPLIVAFIAVGILVGPTGFGWVFGHRTAGAVRRDRDRDPAVPRRPQTRRKLVRTTGRVALITGLGQVLFTSLVGFLLAWVLGMDPTVALYIASRARSRRRSSSSSCCRTNGSWRNSTDASRSGS